MSSLAFQVSAPWRLAMLCSPGSRSRLGLWVSRLSTVGCSRTTAWEQPGLGRLRQRRARVSTRATGSTDSDDDTHRTFDYDLFTIGAGSGGVRASRMAAANYGARVAICDMPYSPIATDDLGGAGGTCVLRGCVPKKLFVFAAEFRHALKDARGFGYEVDPLAPQDWDTFMEKKRAELLRLNGVYGTILKNSGVDYYEGRGKLLDKHTVSVGGKTYTARNILVATGARAFVPRFEGSEHCIVSDDMLEISKVPKRIVVIGAGYIAVEFASIMNGLGAEVHLLYRKDQPLNGFDREVREFLSEELAKSGIKLHPGLSPVAVTKDDASGTFSLRARSHDGSETTITDADHVLAATGRKPNVRNLGLEEVGVDLTAKGAISVDEYSRTRVPSVWAIGDVTDRLNLTPVALMEGMALSQTLFGDAPTAPDHANVATAVFSNPEVGTVGLTEEAAIERYGGGLDIFTSSFKPMKNTISGNEGRAFMKIIVHRETDRVLGIHMARRVGPSAGEIMQGFGVAMKMGVTKRQLDSTVGIHPTSAEELVTMRSVTRRVE